jgi:hypothetical protein
VSGIDDQRRGDPADPARPTAVRVYGWNWGADVERRQGLPWIGIFLVVFGGLLLIERFVPQFRFAGSALLLAVGIVLLLRWAVERGTGWLYAGSIVTALALPGTLQGLGVRAGDGLGTVCLGLAFAFIALVRWQTQGGVGWQAWLAAILIAWGGTRMAIPDIGQLILPALLVAFGLVLVLRGLDRR